MNRKFLENLLRKEITKVDPIGLISMGAPKDEYDSEVEQIVSEINSCRNVKDLEELMYKTFVRMFDERLAGPKEIYRSLAFRIFSKISN